MRQGPGRFDIPNDSPGSIRFVERTFRWGEAREKNVILLLEQVKETPVFTGPTPSMAETLALTATDKNIYVGPIFKVYSSFVYEW